LPVIFTGIKATPDNDSTNTVSWTITNEINVKEYVIGKSSDDQSFVQAATIKASGSNSYQWEDKNLVGTQTYHRIYSIDINGEVHYSNIVEVSNVIANEGIIVYPNPVTGSFIQLKMDNMHAGKYNIRLFNNAGQLIMQLENTYSNGPIIVPLVHKIAAGEYILSVTTPEGKIINLDANLQ
jgi:hypothetical protein